MRILALLLLGVSLAHAGTPDPINSLPSTGATFFTTLQTWMKNEDANEHAEWDQHGANDIFNTLSGGIGIISKGCLGSTVGGLTHSPSSCTAYPGWLRITETGAIIYPDNSTCWVILNKDTTGNTGTFTRVTGTHYLTDCVSSTRPTLPTNALWMMKTTTASGAITAVVDLRKSPRSAGHPYYFASDYGIHVSGGDQTPAITTLAAIPNITIVFDEVGSYELNTAPDIAVATGTKLEGVIGANFHQAAVSTAGNHAVFIVSGKSGVRFRNLSFTQDNATPTYDVTKINNWPIWIRNSDHVLVDRCSFTNIYANAAVRIDANDTATTHSDDNWITDNTFKTCAATGVTVLSGRVNHIARNHFTDCTFGASPASASNVAVGNLFVDNMVTGSVRTPDDAVGQGAFFFAQSASDTGNVFARNQFVQTNFAVTTAYDLDILDNQFRDLNATSAAGAPLVVSGMTRGHIRGNTVYAGSYTVTKADGVGALTIGTSSDVDIGDNTIVGSTTHGIAVKASNARLHIHDNTIRDNTGSGIQVLGTQTGLTFANNHIIDNNTANGATDGGLYFKDSGGGGCTAGCSVVGGEIISPGRDKQGVPITAESLTYVTVRGATLDPRKTSTSATGGAGTVVQGSVLASRTGAAQSTSLATAVDLISTTAPVPGVGQVYTVDAGVSWTGYNASSDTFTYRLIVNTVTVCTLTLTPGVSAGTAFIRASATVQTVGVSGTMNCTIGAAIGTPAAGTLVSNATTGTVVDLSSAVGMALKTQIQQSTTHTVSETTDVIASPSM